MQGLLGQGEKLGLHSEGDGKKLLEGLLGGEDLLTSRISEELTRGKDK